jgi:hypothetical protein
MQKTNGKPVPFGSSKSQSYGVRKNVIDICIRTMASIASQLLIQCRLFIDYLEFSGSNYQIHPVSLDDI